MPLYRWSSGDVAQAECSRAPSGEWQAVLRFREGVTAERLGALQAPLRQKGMAAFIAPEGAQAALMLPQMADESAWRAVLAEGGWTKGAPQSAELPGDTQQVSAQSSFQQPLLMASLFYNLSNLSWIVSGIQRGRHNRGGTFTRSDVAEMMTGATFAVSDTLLGIYGAHKPKHPMIAFSDALSAHLQEHNITLPAPDATPEAIHDSGFFPAANAFLEKHIIPIKSITKIAGGGLIMKSALKPENFNGGKFAAGMLLSSGWLATLLWDKPEQLPFELKEEQESAGATAWLMKNPRGRITAPLAMAANAAKLWGLAGEAKRFHGAVRTARGVMDEALGPAREAAGAELRYAERRQYDYAWNAVSTGALLIGNYEFGLSGKRAAPPEDQAGFQREMLVAAANLLAAMPDKARAHAIDETAEYIAGIKGVEAGKEEVAQSIGRTVAALRQMGVSREERLSR